MDLKRLSGSIGKTWENSIVDRLVAYVRIPNKSPDFDPQWERNGHMEAAVQLMAQWCRAQPLTGMRVEVRRLPGRTPLLLLDVPGELPGCVLLYGHLDKQPEFTGWLPGTDRGLRRKRQRRSARASRVSGRDPWGALARGVPGRGVRQLRSGVVHDLAARQSARHAAGARAHRGRAFRHGDRHRAEPVSHSRATPGPYREPDHRRSAAR